MTETQENSSVASASRLPLLRSESADEYVAVFDELKQEIRPKGIVELFYVEDMASLIFEIRRLRRCKTSVINIAYLAALQSLLKQLLVDPDIWLRDENETKAEELSLNWFTKETAKKGSLQASASVQSRRVGDRSGSDQAESGRS